MAMLDEQQFANAVKESKTFKNSEGYRKLIINKRPNMKILYGYYHAGYNFGLPELRKNKNVSAISIEILSEILTLR